MRGRDVDPGPQGGRRGKGKTRHTRGAVRRREPGDHALGRSRGGYGSKVHVVCDRTGLVLAFRVTAGQINECTEFQPLLERIRFRGNGGHHRSRPDAIAGDKGYSTHAIRAWCRRHHVRPVVAERDDQQAHRRHRPGRKPQFDREHDRQRNIVERAIGWLRNLRRIAYRAEKLAGRYAAMVTVALITCTAHRLSDRT